MVLEIESGSTLWTTRLGIGYGPVVRQTTERMIQSPVLQNLCLVPVSLRSSVPNGRVTFSLNNGMYTYNQIIPL